MSTMLLKKKKKLQLKIENPTSWFIRIFSRHNTHAILRRKIKLPFQCIYRLGSITEIEDGLYEGGKIVEINSVQSIKNSMNKRTMKECFTQAGVRCADWFIYKGADIFAKQQIGNTSSEVPITGMPYPIISKSLQGSRGVGNILHKDAASLDNFVKTHDVANYIFEKYYTYSREYRIHVSRHGYFYTCRKMLKKDTPENERYQRHDDNSSWILEENELFDKPINWDEIVKHCQIALEGLEGDIMAFDVKCQSTLDSKGNKRENPEFILIESASAASFGNITSIKYLEELPKVAFAIAKEYSIYTEPIIQQ